MAGFENTLYASSQGHQSQAINICIVEDDPVFSKLLKNTLDKNPIYSISQCAQGKEFFQLKRTFDIIIIDYNLPDINGLDLIKKIKAGSKDPKTIIVSGQTDIEVVVKCYKAGADNYIIKNENCLPEIENTIKNLSTNVHLKKQVDYLKSALLDRNKYDKIIGESPQILKVLKLIEKAEKSDILVLLTGKSGTGKELAAKAIHYNSPRKKKNFVPVNMAAIPKDLIESELFGHEKGAFTGAIARRIGKFEEANGGTLFLDEIGEMEPDLQAKILRIIEDKQLIRVGSNTSINLDIRIIAATNRDLKHEVKNGNFREELYYRLQGFLIDIPPLSQRKDDVLLLSSTFLTDFTKKNKMEEMSISKESANTLLNYSWPGNIRELKSVIERAALLSNNNTISPQELMLNDDENIIFEEADFTLEDYKLKIITQYLEKFQNNIDLVAEKLNIGKATIYRTLKKIDSNN